MNLPIDCRKHSKSAGVSRDPSSTNHQQAGFIQQPVSLHPQQPAVILTSSTNPTQLPFAVGGHQLPVAISTMPLPPPVIGQSINGPPTYTYPYHFKPDFGYGRNENGWTKRGRDRQHGIPDSDSTNDNDDALTSHRHGRRHTDDYSGDYSTTQTIGNGHPASHQNPSRTGYGNVVDDPPLSAIYFEPSFNHDYLQPVSDLAWGTDGYGTTQNRGVQNVPLMSTIGIQYAVDQTGSRVPIGTVPVGSGEVPGGTVPTGFREFPTTVPAISRKVLASRPTLPLGSREVPAVTVPAGSCHVPAGIVPATSSEFPIDIVPAGSWVVPSSTVPAGYREVPAGTVPVGSGVPSFYQPSAAAYTSPYGSHPMGTSVSTVPGGQPVVVSGSLCPLCGRQDYHVHTDGGVANASNRPILVSGSAPAAAVSSTAIPINVAPGQFTFLTG